MLKKVVYSMNYRPNVATTTRRKRKCRMQTLWQGKLDQVPSSCSSGLYKKA